MSDKVYASVPEVLSDLKSGVLTEQQAMAWISGMNARKVSFKLGVSTGNKVSIRCKGTNGRFGLSLYAVTLTEILKNAAEIKAFLAENLDTLEIRPQDREEIESVLFS